MIARAGRETARVLSQPAANAGMYGVEALQRFQRFASCAKDKFVHQVHRT
jgi:hypothetical protein